MERLTYGNRLKPALRQSRLQGSSGTMKPTVSNHQSYLQQISLSVLSWGPNCYVWKVIQQVSSSLSQLVTNLAFLGCAAH